MLWKGPEPACMAGTRQNVQVGAIYSSICANGQRKPWRLQTMSIPPITHFTLFEGSNTLYSYLPGVNARNGPRQSGDSPRHSRLYSATYINYGAGVDRLVRFVVVEQLLW